MHAKIDFGWPFWPLADHGSKLHRVSLFTLLPRADQAAGALPTLQNWAGTAEQVNSMQLAKVYGLFAIEGVVRSSASVRGWVSRSSMMEVPRLPIRKTSTCSTLHSRPLI